ncbi:MAG: cytochrome C oxidase subunit IV family protein [Burkholderiaceae bacterium]|nr:cytochrome C oxidase subunit IV family protein [Burkholderiaceae bacterium]
MTRTLVFALVFVWVALMALLASTLALAYVPLGDGNLVAALGIAVVKSALVVWWFMRLNEASAKTRIAAGVALAFFALLAGLSGVDYATRARNGAPVQDAKQLAPRFEPAPPPGSPLR